MNRREFLIASTAAVLLPTTGWAAPTIRLRAGPVNARILPEPKSLTPMLGFNGSTPGPELRARQGDRMSVAFENGTERHSAVHWHGIHLDNAMDGVPNLTQAAVEPDETFHYEFDVPYAGTYWYHAHHRSWEQVARGLYGPLIVEEPDPPAVDRDITVVLDDWRLERNGSLHESFGNRHDFSHAGRIGNVARAMFSRNVVRRGDRIRLRLINAATARIFAVSVDGGNGKVVAHDGMPLTEPLPPDDLLLAPAQRTDLVLDVTGPVSFTLRTRQGSYGLGTIAVSGSNPAPIDAPIRPLPPAQVPVPDPNGAARLTLVMQGGAMGGLQRPLGHARGAVVSLLPRRDGPDHAAQRHRVSARHPPARPPFPRDPRRRRPRPLPGHDLGRPAAKPRHPLRVRQSRQMAPALPHAGAPGVRHEDLGGGRMTRVLPVLALLWPALAIADHELDNRDIGNGRVLYQEHCASCHGVRLEGQPNWQEPGKDGILPAPPHDETGHTWHHDNRLLFDYTKLGGQALMEAMGITGFKSGMQGLGDVMSDDEIWDVLAYIRSSWPDRIRKIQATRNPEHGQ